MKQLIATIILIFTISLLSAQNSVVFNANTINWGGNLETKEASVHVYDSLIAIAHEPNIYKMSIMYKDTVIQTEFYTTVKYITTNGSMLLIEYNPEGIEKVDAYIGETVINFRQFY